MPIQHNPGDAPAQQSSVGAAPEKQARSMQRISMSVPQLRLEVPEVPGYYLYWFLGRSIQRAIRAGYTFVEDGDVDVPNLNVAGDASASGNSDMGTRISVIAGGLDEGTAEPQRLYLMKIPQELRDQDVQAIEANNERIAAALRGGQMPPSPNGAAPNETPKDRLQRYLKTGQDLFLPKRR